MILQGRQRGMARAQLSMLLVQHNRLKEHLTIVVPECAAKVTFIFRSATFGHIN